jgi:hypothetical protein
VYEKITFEGVAGKNPSAVPPMVVTSYTKVLRVAPVCVTVPGTTSVKPSPKFGLARLHPLALNPTPQTFGMSQYDFEKVICLRTSCLLTT